jgi:MFS family permease
MRNQPQDQEAQAAVRTAPAHPPASGLAGALGAMAFPNFRLYWFSAFSFVLGWQVLRIIIAWEIYDLTNSAVYLGLAGGVMGVATLSVNLLGGVAADRVNRRALLIITQSAMTASVLVLLALSSAGMLAAWHLLAVSAVIGVIQGIDQPTRTAVIPALVPDRRHLMNALALGSSVWQGTRIFGPALGGVMVRVAGATATLGLVSVGFLVGTFLLWFLHIPRIERQAGAVVGELVEGLRFIAKNGMFASLIALTFVDSFFGVAYIQLMPIFARDILDIGIEGMGVLFGASAAGALIGTLTAAFFVRGRWPLLLLLGGAAAFGMLVIVFGLSSLVWVSLAALFLSGTFNSLSMITNQTILQAAVPEELRGRVMGVFSLTYSLIPLGGAQAGFVANYIGAPLTVALGGGIAVLFSAFLATRRGFKRAVIEAVAATKR